MVFLVVCGYRYMGSCDYFTYNNQEYHVNARMFHVQFCPIVVEEAVLRLPFNPDRVLNIDHVSNIRMRCFFWASVRSYIFLISLIALIIGLVQLNGSSGVAALFITLAVIGFLAGVGALFYKPKAPADREAIYIEMFGGHVLPSTVTGVPLGTKLDTPPQQQSGMAYPQGTYMPLGGRPQGHV